MAASPFCKRTRSGGSSARNLRILPLGGVLYRQYMGMQSLSAKGHQRELGLVRQQGRFRSKTGAVDIVTQQRMADRGQVDPDLVGSAGFERAGQQARYRPRGAASGEPLRGLRSPVYAPEPPNG